MDCALGVLALGALILVIYNLYQNEIDCKQCTFDCSINTEKFIKKPKKLYFCVLDVSWTEGSFFKFWKPVSSGNLLRVSGTIFLIVQL